MRRLFALLFVILFLSCGKDQFSGSFNLNFDKTALCESRITHAQLTNDTGEEMIIAGVAIESGTDRFGNFSLEGVTIAGNEVASVGGTLSEVTVPPGAVYSFQISYTPKDRSREHNAILDIAYREPETGLLQLHLTGSPDESLPGICASPSEGGEVGFDGALTLTIDQIIAATSKLDAALNSDDGIEPFAPAAIPLTLSLAEGSAELGEIKSGTFVLPKPRPDVPTLGSRITRPTGITTTGPGSGIYDPSQGVITLENLEIKLEGDFITTVITTLTTEELSLSGLPVLPNSNALKAFGLDHFDSVGKRIFGGRIDAEGEVTLVGVTEIESSTLADGADRIFNDLRGTTLAILIKGTISGSPSAPPDS